MSLRLDLHMHTESHGKTVIDHETLKRAMRQNGIDGVAVTNFFDISHARWLKKMIPEAVIIVGQEIWTEDGHIIGLGLRERIPDKHSAEDTVGCIHDQGGIAVAPHPFLFLGVGEKAAKIGVDAIEAYNGLIGATVIFNRKAEKLSQQTGIPGTASSDTTAPDHVGRSHTEILTDNPSEILHSIRSGCVKLKKSPIPIPALFILKNFLNFKDFEPSPLHSVSCFICHKSMAVRLFKKRYECIDCGNSFDSRIACCNGHFLCQNCIIKRGFETVQRVYI